MNVFDLIELLENDEIVNAKGVFQGYKGIIISLDDEIAEVLFLNDKDLGDYAFLKIEKHKLKVIGELPKELFFDLEKFVKTIKKEEHKTLKVLNVKEYDKVELISDDPLYLKYGIKKGEVGCVMDETAVNGYVMVDFSGIDEKGEFYGDCISVKIEDLKVLY